MKAVAVREYDYYIAGEFKKSDLTIDVVNPAKEEVFARIFETSGQDIVLAIEKAKKAQEVWRKTSFKERAKVLRDINQAMLDNLQVLAELETREIGKPLKESLFVDITLGAEVFNYYASFLESLEEEFFPGQLGMDFIKYDPFGLCGVYLPYNVPLMIFGFTCAAALAAGNAIIVKPSEYGSLSMLELARHLDRLDIPRGLISVISGRGEVSGKTLSKSDIDIISFTGSRDALKKIMAQSADTPKKIVCELGGCNLSVVFSDADKEKALQNILGSSFIKQGQMCIGTSLVLVEQDCYRDFIAELTSRTAKIKIADPFLPDTGIGALPSKEHRDQLQARINALKEKGAKVICGGKPLDGKGYFYPPTLIEVKDVIYEEFFAPVIMVKSFNKGEIGKIIEDNPTGLVLQIWTRDLDRAYALAQTARCGTVWINTCVQMDSQTPFGGAQRSGWGRNLGKAGFFEYIQPKHIGIGFKRTPIEGWFGV